ncbi:hypothetical protein Mterra_02962 [Calidithermus terrae]|uniref:Prokaryotic cytochrome b561 n=1 Tax=Calidithermus terrae TaxID=1408545 RepID=A0A399EFH3_9DEIN|nr:hypothetical protein [Calidithermus terrae]RIH81780.1 hypothetical protein Mterra_02962 [Calidithermus terrae]
MYDLSLTLHNLTRWLVLGVALVLIFRSVQGLRRGGYVLLDRRLGMAYTGLLDLQLLLGLILFAVSPFIRGLTANVSAAMQNSSSRFFLAEHWVAMLVALVLAHVGSSRVKKATDDRQKHRQSLIFYGLSLALVLLGIPWWRPLLP